MFYLISDNSLILCYSSCFFLVCDLLYIWGKALLEILSLGNIFTGPYEPLCNMRKMYIESFADLLVKRCLLTLHFKFEFY